MNNYKDNETVNITLERYETLKKLADSFIELRNSILNSNVSEVNKELIIDKEKLLQIFVLADKSQFGFKIGGSYDDIKIEDIKFKKVNS